MSRRRSLALDVHWDGKFDAQGQRCEFDAAGGKALQRIGCTLNLEQAFSSSANAAKGSLILADALAHRGDLIKRFGSKLDLIYLDPPFATQREHHAKYELAGDQTLSLPAYDDRWGEGEASYAHFLWRLLMLSRALLHTHGAIWLHVPVEVAPLARALLDDVFGAANFSNQIIWHYTGGGRSRSRFSNKHDVLFWYGKSDQPFFDPDSVRVPYAESSGYAKSGIRAKSGKLYQPHPAGTIPDDVWSIPMVNPMAAERLGYPTQKPLALLERIVQATCPPGGIVGDLCCGSGTTLVAALKHQRRFVGADPSGVAQVASLRRLLCEGAGKLELLCGESFKLAESTEARARVDRTETGVQLVRVDWPQSAGIPTHDSRDPIALWGWLLDGELSVQPRARADQALPELSACDSDGALLVAADWQGDWYQLNVK